MQNIPHRRLHTQLLPEGGGGCDGQGFEGVPATSPLNVLLRSDSNLCLKKVRNFRIHIYMNRKSEISELIYT
jgi:hypothetical protein